MDENNNSKYINPQLKQEFETNVDLGELVNIPKHLLMKTLLNGYNPKTMEVNLDTQQFTHLINKTFSIISANGKHKLATKVNSKGVWVHCPHGNPVLIDKNTWRPLPSTTFKQVSAVFDKNVDEQMNFIIVEFQKFCKRQWVEAYIPD